MKAITALTLFIYSLCSLDAQTQTWQNFFVGPVTTVAPVVLGTAILQFPLPGTNQSWVGTLSAPPTGSYEVVGFGQDSAKVSYALYSQVGTPNTAIPIGYISKVNSSLGVTQYFGISGVQPQLLGVSPLGNVFIVGFDEATALETLYQLGNDGQLTTIFKVSITYFDAGNGLPGPIEVDENNDISIGATVQLGAGTFSPATYLFYTTGPVPYAASLANTYVSGSKISIQATASLPITYQWSLNGAVIPGATSSSYTPTSQGTYSITASTTAGSVTLSTFVTVPVPIPPGQLVNISCRADIGTGGNIGIAGFVISGTANEQVLIRGVGPTLSEFSVSGVLSQPVLTVFNSTGTQVATNTGWSTNANAAQIGAAASTAGAFTLPAGSADSALLLSLAPGAYTAQVSGLNNTTGDALIEVYQLPSPTPTPTP